MAYRILGLDPAPYRHLFNLPDEALAATGVQRLTVTAKPGYPCRVSLDDVQAGGTVLLINHQSVSTGPFRATHAIFIDEAAAQPAVYRDAIPPALNRRVLSLRGFDDQQMMVEAILAQPDEADTAIRALLANDAVRYIHAHNAVRGCFAATVERAT